MERTWIFKKRNSLHEHGDRDGEGDGRQDDRPQGVVQAHLDDEVVDGDDGRLDGDGDPQQEQREDPVREACAAADDDVRRHERDNQDHGHGGGRDEGRVHEVHGEVVVEDGHFVSINSI